MVKVKFAFGLSILIVVVLISGCLESNKSTSTIETIINLHAKQIILDDNDIKNIIGNDWEKSEQLIDQQSKKTGADKLILNSDVSSVYFKQGQTMFTVITLYVSPDMSSTNTNYQQKVLNLEATGKTIKNKVEIGDMGEIYTFIGLQENLNGQIILIFRKNNIIAEIYTPETDVETVLILAKKQEAKISRILEMIQ